MAIIRVRRTSSDENKQRLRARSKRNVLQGLTIKEAGVSSSCLPARLIYSTFGLGALRWQELSEVTVSGPAGTVRVKEASGRWRSVRSYALPVKPADAKFAHKLVNKQATTLCNDLRFNVVGTDVRGATGSLDFLGYFTKCFYGCLGRLWTELKAWNELDFEANRVQEETSLAERFPRELKRDSSLCGVLLVATKVKRCGREWGETATLVRLWKPTAETWVTVADDRRRKGRGQVQGQKLPLRRVLDAVEWVKDEDGRKVGYLKHFLKALSLPGNNTDSRALSFNSQLSARGLTVRLEQKAIPGKCGRAPWVGSRETLRRVYDLV